jgi:hypothetical protein
MIFEILRKSSPSNPANGYGDRGRLYDDNGNIIWEQDNKVSSCPNPTSPHTGLPWDNGYAMIKAGEYSGNVINDIQNGHGMCIVINNYGPVPTLLPDYNKDPGNDHYGKFYAKLVLVHKGYSLTWRGSEACCTISPDVYDSLFTLLPVGTNLKVQVIEAQ